MVLFSLFSYLTITDIFNSIFALHRKLKQATVLKLNTRTKQTVNWTWAKLSWNCNSGLFNMSQWYICLNLLRMYFLYFIQFLLKLLITIFWKNYLLKRHLFICIQWLFFYTQLRKVSFWHIFYPLANEVAKGYSNAIIRR